MSALGDLYQAGWECLGPREQILGELSRATLHTVVVRLARRGSMHWALDDSCVHAGAPLPDGWLAAGRGGLPLALASLCPGHGHGRVPSGLGCPSPCTT